jgi:hypothetical protein
MKMCYHLVMRQVFSMYEISSIIALSLCVFFLVLINSPLLKNDFIWKCEKQSFKCFVFFNIFS